MDLSSYLLLEIKLLPGWKEVLEVGYADLWHWRSDGECEVSAD